MEKIILLILFLFTFFLRTDALGHSFEKNFSTNDPDFAIRQARQKYLLPHKMSKALSQRATNKLNFITSDIDSTTQESAPRVGKSFAFPFTAKPELKSKGRVETLTFLIDFRDHKSNLDSNTIALDIYESGSSNGRDFFPFESLNKYYERASEGKLNVKGDVIDWYSFPNNRASYQYDGDQPREHNKAIFKIFDEVMTAHDPVVDYGKYDNDKDGDIDLVTILYAGPPGTWNSFWWAIRWEFSIREALTKRYDGKRVKQFVFQFIDTRDGLNNIGFDPETLIHEYGHALGVGDYYDYTPEVAPFGGSGGLDIMDSASVNHSAFNRWLLDWDRPEFLSVGSKTRVSLAPSGRLESNYPKAYAILPSLNNPDFGEYPENELFMIENRQFEGNDLLGLPGDGLMIWHINAALDNHRRDFRYDNSDTKLKLLRMVRKDNPEDYFEGEQADASSLFKQGDKFSSSSIPRTLKSADQSSYVFKVDNIKVDQNNILTADLDVSEDSSVFESGNNLISGEKLKKRIVQYEEFSSISEEASGASLDELSRMWKGGSNGIASTTFGQQLILSEIASKDGLLAMGYLSKTNPIFQRDTFEYVFSAWLESDPFGAVSWYFDKKNIEYRKSRGLQLTQVLAKEVVGLYLEIEPSTPNKLKVNIEAFVSVPEIYGLLLGMQEVADLNNLKLDSVVEGLRDYNQKGGIDEINYLLAYSRLFSEDSALSSSDRVKYAEAALVKLGAFSQENKNLKTQGGVDIKQALLNFQKRMGLPNTSLFDEATFEAMFGLSPIKDHEPNESVSFDLRVDSGTESAGGGADRVEYFDGIRANGIKPNVAVKQLNLPQEQRDLSFSERASIADATPKLPGYVTESGGYGKVDNDGNFVPYSVIEPDTRTAVINTQEFPASAIVQINFSSDSGHSQGNLCSGTMISPDTVLTAGHCLHSGTVQGQLYSNHVIYPGRKKTTKPFGSCKAIKIYVLAGWVSASSQLDARDYDLGAIKLDCNIGESTGWLGVVETNPSTSSETTIQGYTSNKAPRGMQWISSDLVNEWSSEKVFYKNDTAKGTSGAPVFDANQMTIFAVHTNGVHGGVSPWNANNAGTRITSERLSQIIDWVNDD